MATWTPIIEKTIDHITILKHDIVHVTVGLKQQQQHVGLANWSKIGRTCRISVTGFGWHFVQTPRQFLFVSDVADRCARLTFWPGCVTCSAFLFDRATGVFQIGKRCSTWREKIEVDMSFLPKRNSFDPDLSPADELCNFLIYARNDMCLMGGVRFCKNSSSYGSIGIQWMHLPWILWWHLERKITKSPNRSRSSLTIGHLAVLVCVRPSSLIVGRLRLLSVRWRNSTVCREYASEMSPL